MLMSDYNLCYFLASEVKGGRRDREEGLRGG